MFFSVKINEFNKNNNFDKVLFGERCEILKIPLW